MRRLPAAVTVAAALVGLAASAHAAPPPLHESTSALTVPAKVRAVVIEVDQGSVSVSAGTPNGKVKKQWNLKEPTFTSSFKSGTLTLRGTCRDTVNAVVVNVYAQDLDCNVNIALSVPAGASVQVQASQVSTTGMKGTLNLEGFNGVTVDHAGPGAVTAASDTGTLRLSSSNPRSAKLTANNAMQVQDVTTGNLTANSSTASATLTRVHATAASVEANNEVSITGLRAGWLTATSDTGGAALNDVKITESMRTSANNAVTLAHVVAPQADVTSSTSGVTTSDSAFGHLTMEGNSLLSLTGVTAATAKLTSDTSGMTIRSSALPDLTGAANNTVDVVLNKVPRRVTLTSYTSSLTLDVPRATYAVSANSSNGHVTYGDIVVDPHSSRYLDLTAQNDITVN